MIPNDSRLAGALGFEPRRSVLETDSLPLSLCPLFMGLLFFRLLMQNALTAPFAEFFKLDFAFHFLFIFARPIVDSLARAALELD